MFKITYTLIHNRGCETITILSKSVKSAIKRCRIQAWRQYDASGATNWADVYLTIYKGNEVIYSDFAPSSCL
jgi:hypothetical protein